PAAEAAAALAVQPFRHGPWPQPHGGDDQGRRDCAVARQRVPRQRGSLQPPDIEENGTETGGLSAAERTSHVPPHAVPAGDQIADTAWATPRFFWTCGDLEPDPAL